MASPMKKGKRTTDFSIRSLIDDRQNDLEQHSTSPTSTSPSKSASNESFQYSPSSSSTCTTSASGIMRRLSWSNQPAQAQWLPDAEIIDKARMCKLLRVFSRC
jgi:hypothetical protein